MMNPENVIDAYLIHELLNNGYIIYNKTNN